MKFTLTISDEDFNTILTALYFERQRAEKEENNTNLAYIEHAIDAIQDNTYVDNVMEEMTYENS